METQAHHAERVRALTNRQEDAVAALLPLLQSNQFYRNKLRAVGIERPVDFWTIPFTTKSELIRDQREYPPFGSNLTFGSAAYTRICQTSGTGGAPLYWLDTEESWRWMLNNWSEVYRVANVTNADSIFFAFSFGPFLGFWTAFEAAAQLGTLVIPSGGLTSIARLQRIVDLGATVLCCTPSYALRLALTAAEHGIDLGRSKISRIVVAGECGGSFPSTRLRIENAWNGARVVDHYGMTEVGPAGYGCPSRPDVLHIIEDSYICEVVKPASGVPVDPGECGELVLTPLRRCGSPVLRYRTGDLVKRPIPSVCACGSHDIALEHGILGRIDDMVIVRGVNVYPTAVERLLYEHGVINYHVDVVEQRGMPELHIRIEGTEQQLGNIDQQLQSTLGFRVQLSSAESGTLPYSDGKAKRWTRHY